MSGTVNLAMGLQGGGAMEVPIDDLVLAGLTWRDTRRSDGRGLRRPVIWQADPC